MSKRHGRYCSVRIAAVAVLGMGAWSMSGITSDQIEVTDFGDNWKDFEFGAKDGGTISFNGFCDPDDTVGQLALIDANVENTDLSDLKLYIDSTSFFEPCQTAGYLHPGKTTGADTAVSHVNVTSFNVDVDKTGMLNISFEAKVSGVMVLV
jgi:hypothetical protein